MKKELLNGPKSLYLLEGYTNGQLEFFKEGARIKNKAWVNQNNESEHSSLYIKIDPTATFYYDIIYSNQTAGNLFYIGFERYDKNMTETSNNSTIYVITKNTVADNVRATGTVDLSTNLSGNPTQYIRLRILNNWTNSTVNDGILEIKGLSLIQKHESNFPKIEKTSVASADFFRENNLNEAKIFKYEGIESNCFYEI